MSSSVMDGHKPSAPAQETALADREQKFFGHPWGLANLSGIEMWERFSFYGMQALVAYYIYYSAGEGGLGYSEAVATSIVGAYGGLVYLSAIFGAWVSDRLFGAERTLTGAAVLIMCGHISLALIPGMAGVGVGLICVAVGAGTLKATTSVVVGGMYRREDNRRDAAFSIYYMAVNIGGLLGPLVTGAVWQAAGFHWGFALAAIGMAAGLLQYLILRRRTLAGIAETADDPASSKTKATAAGLAVAAIAVIAVAAWAGALTLENLSTVVTVITLVAAVVLFTVMLTSKKLDRVERSRVLAFIPMFLASVVFWALFQQQFTSIAVAADQALDRNLFGWEFPASWVQSINPAFIIVFAGIFSALWLKLGNRNPAASNQYFMAVGIASIVVGIVMAALSKPIVKLMHGVR